MVVPDKPPLEDSAVSWLAAAPKSQHEMTAMASTRAKAGVRGDILTMWMVDIRAGVR